MLINTNIFIIIISLFIVALPSGGIKILLNKFFNFDSQPFLWLQYSLFYMVTFGIYLFVSLKLPYDNSSKVLTILGIVIAEIVIFYFRYYSLENKLQYSMFVFFSTLLNGVLIRFLSVILFTFLVLIPS